MAYRDPSDPRNKAAKRKYYEGNKSAYMDRRRVLEDELRKILRAAKDKPCADCGVRYPYYVMQFDHLGDKVCDVGLFVKRGNKAGMLAEIAKCEVVCANCHAERTHMRLELLRDSIGPDN